MNLPAAPSFHLLTTCASFFSQKFVQNSNITHQNNPKCSNQDCSIASSDSPLEPLSHNSKESCTFNLEAALPLGATGSGPICILLQSLCICVFQFLSSWTTLQVNSVTRICCLFFLSVTATSSVPDTQVFAFLVFSIGRFPVDLVILHQRTVEYTPSFVARRWEFTMLLDSAPMYQAQFYQRLTTCLISCGWFPNKPFPL